MSEVQDTQDSSSRQVTADHDEAKTDAKTMDIADLEKEFVMVKKN